MNDRVGRVVGSHLRFLRLAAGLTQESIALSTGIHRPIVARIERGLHNPSLETVARYAVALGLSLVDVLSCLDGLRICPRTGAVLGGTNA